MPVGGGATFLMEWDVTSAKNLVPVLVPSVGQT